MNISVFARVLRLACVLTTTLLVAASVHAANFTVVNTNDSGPGSLRQAILDANAAGSGDVVFAIGSGAQTIAPLTKLPPATFSGTIDGRTQPGFSSGPLVEIDCSLVGSVPCMEAGPGGVVRSLVINRAPGVGLSLDRAAVYGCYIGTNHSGFQSRANGTGVRCLGCTAGSPLPGDGNVISGNRMQGILVQASSAASRIRDNIIGGDSSAVTDVDNNIGIEVTTGASTAGVTIGGPTGADGNRIIGNRTGIRILMSTSVLIRNNQIGVGLLDSSVPNDTGILIDGSSDNVVQENQIWWNNGPAIAVRNAPARHNTFLSNSVYASHGGIDLDNNLIGAFQNDPGDGDTGPNNLQNHPVLTTATSVDGVTRLAGTLDSLPNTSFTIELFSSPNCDPFFRNRDGKTPIGSTVVTTSSLGIATFDVGFQFSLPAGSSVTAIATGPDGSSEIAPCALVVSRGFFALAPSTAVNESSTVTLDVYRIQGSTGTATVTWTAGGGTAQNGADYTAPGGVLSFADGENTKTITIPVIDDSLFEGDESFVVTLSNPTGGTTIFAPQSTATITIRENDPAPELNVPPSVIFDEGNGGPSNAAITVQLTGPAAIPIEVQYTAFSGTASPGSDYGTINGILTFAAGETIQSLPLPIIGDTVRENDEIFSVLMASPYSSQEVFVTIRDDEPLPRISISDLTVVEGSGERTVHLTVQASEPVSAHLLITTSNGTATKPEDYDVTPSSVSFGSGTEVQIPILIKGDGEVETDEWFTVRIVASPLGQEVEVVRPEATVTIVNDDTGVGPATQRIAVGEAGVIAIELGAPIAAQGVIQLESSNPSVIAVPSSITIHPGDRRTGFDARALSLGSANITVRLPDGSVHHVTATTFIRHRLVLTPDELALFDGQTVPVTASLQPSNDLPVTVTLESAGDAITLPSSLVIPPHGSVTFDVVAVKQGPIVIHARIGGDDAGTLFGQVAEAPARPTIFRITPSRGPTAGGTELAVTGVLFLDTCNLRFGGIPATSVQYVRQTELRVITPAHAEGTVDVLLTCPGGTSLYQNSFTFVGAPPALSSVTPAAGNIGGGTEVRIAGSHFRNSCWPSFGGVAAPAAAVLDPSTMTATVPPHAAGAADLTLRCTEGEALLAGAFTFVATPDAAALIASIDPRSGAPGETVAITGTGFRRSDRITFGGVAATILETAAGRQLVRVPELPPGPTGVTLTDAEGRVITGPVFTVLEAVPPFITSVTPGSAPAGAELTLEGRGFRPGYVFRIGGLTATVLSLEYTRIVLRLHAEAVPGTHPIEVRNAAGLLIGAGPSVTITEDGLAIFAISLPCTSTEGNVLATLTGRGFTAGTLVTFNGIAAPDTTVVDGTTIRTRVPAGEAGPAVIQVRAGDERATLTSKFRYVSPFDPNGCGGGRSRSVRH